MSSGTDPYVPPGMPGDDETAVVMPGMDDSFPLASDLGDNVLDYIDETVAAISGAEVEERLRSTLRRAGYLCPDEGLIGDVPAYPFADGTESRGDAGQVAAEPEILLAGAIAADEAQRWILRQWARAELRAARREAERVTAEAREEADRALSQAAGIVRDARNQAQRILDDACREAEEIREAARRTAPTALPGRIRASAGVLRVQRELAEDIMRTTDRLMVGVVLIAWEAKDYSADAAPAGPGADVRIWNFQANAAPGSSHRAIQFIDDWLEAGWMDSSSPVARRYLELEWGEGEAHEAASGPASSLPGSVRQAPDDRPGLVPR
jgi:hypothetical protein